MNTSKRARANQDRFYGVYSLRRLFNEPVPKRHVKVLRPIYSAVPFTTFRRRGKQRRIVSAPEVKKDSFPLKYYLAGARHILRQEQRLQFKERIVNKCWNRFTMLRNLPDQESMTYEAPGKPPMVMRKNEAIFRHKKMSGGTWLPMELMEQEKAKYGKLTGIKYLASFDCHRGNRIPAYTETRKVVTFSMPKSKPTKSKRRDKQNKVRRLLGEPERTRCIKGVLVERKCLTIDMPGSIWYRIWKGPPLSPFYVKLIERMRRIRQERENMIMDGIIGKPPLFTFNRQGRIVFLKKHKQPGHVPNTKKLAKRIHIARCVRRTLAVMKLFTKYGHDVRHMILTVLGEPKYRRLRRLTRIMRRRQTTFLTRAENLHHHAQMRQAGRKRQLKRRRRRRYRNRGPVCKPYGSSPVYRKPRKLKNVHLRLSRRKVCNRPDRYDALVTRRKNCRKLVRHLVINTPARVKGNKRR